MDRRPLALVLLALLLAGCAAPDADPPRQAPVADAPAPEAEPEPPAQPPAADAAPAKVDVHLVHDYRDAAEKTTFEIPAGSPPVRLRAGFRSPDGLSACSGQDTRLVVTGPDGAALYDLKGPTINLGMTDCESEAPGEKLVQAPGTYTVEFAGTGAIVGFVDAVTAS